MKAIFALAAISLLAGCASLERSMRHQFSGHLQEERQAELEEQRWRNAVLQGRRESKPNIKAGMSVDEIKELWNEPNRTEIINEHTVLYYTNDGEQNPVVFVFGANGLKSFMLDYELLNRRREDGIRTAQHEQQEREAWANTLTTFSNSMNQQQMIENQRRIENRQLDILDSMNDSHSGRVRIMRPR